MYPEKSGDTKSITTRNRISFVGRFENFFKVVKSGAA